MKKEKIIILFFFIINCFRLGYSKDLNEIEKKKVKIRQDFLKRKRIEKFYKNWKNTKYKWGGDTKSGIDCSALMKKLYEEKFLKKISRTTLTQVNEGDRIENRKDWRVGDLIFFKTGKNTRHVGVYLGGNKFMHSGSSKGVTISYFDEYWKKRYWQTRRIPVIVKRSK